MAFKNNYLKAKSLCNKLTKEAKADYFARKVAHADGDSRELWRIINNASMRTTSSTSKGVIEIKSGDNTINDIEKIANTLNEYYANVGQNIANNLPPPESALHIDCHHNSSLTVISPTNAEEIIEIISSLKSHTAPGPDNITIDDLKAVKDLIARPLSNLINNHLCCGTFPDELKRSIIIPVHKGGEQSDMNNYRPIALLDASIEKPTQEDAEQGDQYSDEENEEDEEEEPETVEKDFKFEDFAKRLLNPKIIRACTIALADWEAMPTKSLKAAVTLLYRVAFELKCVAMLYQATLFKIFQKVFNTPRDKHNDELRKLAIYVIRQFVETAPNNPKIFPELLFYKTLKEANDLENGYADTEHGSTKGAWTEEQEIELRLLFEENQNNPQTDQDVIDWILDNLIDKTRTRRGVLKKLKEMSLMFKAPTKKSTAAAAQKHLWQHDEDERLKNLYDEFRLENDCLARLTEAFAESRSKNLIIKRMIQLGLIADRSEILPKKVKKSRAKKQNSDESDIEYERPQKSKSRKSTKPPKATKKKTKKPKRPTKSPLDIGAVKFLLLQCQENFADALDWLKECMNDAAADFEEDMSEDNDDGVPILPLQAIEKEAMEDETFKNLLMALGIQPPIEGSDAYWKIPVYLNANDLKTRVQVLDGNLDVMPVESVDAGERDDDEDDDSDASQDTNEDTASSASDDSDNDDNDSANESDSNANFLSKRRQHFDNLVFNQSDNEDEHRAPLKPKKRREAATKASSDGKKSKGRGHSSKRLDINDMLMGEDSDENDDGSREKDNQDNDALEDFDSENLRKRLAELVDNDDDDDDKDNDGDITSVNNASAKTPRRIRRNVIESDSSEDEMEINDTSNQTTRSDKRERTDNQSSINANNKVDKDIVDVTVDINNQSSTLLANNSGELGEVPSNSLRMSPTPEDEDDNVANINVDNNKRTRKESNDEVDGDDDGDEEEIVAKKKKLNEPGAGSRRWATIIDEDSD